MQIKPDEITSILKSRIEGLDVDEADLAEVGTVLSVGDGIARIHGLDNCEAFEMLELPHDVTGLALNLESDNVGAVLFGDWEEISEGDTAKRTGHLLEIPVGDELLGRIVDPLGRPLDGKGDITTNETRPANGPVETTIIVARPADEAAPIKFMAPYAGCAMAEHFLYDGKAALCVYDDLTKHAYAYRQMSLLLRRPPGREAYPGDVFYLHSRLLERACKLSDEQGGGSLTALPIIETQAGDVSAYIPTNVISITDGQIFLEADLFFSGVRPAINVGISVSRVGGNAQVKAMRQVAGRLRLDLAQYRELEAISQFGSELDQATPKQLARSSRVVEGLKQPQYQPMPVDQQVIGIFAVTSRRSDDVAGPQIKEWEKGLLDFMEAQHPEIAEEIRTRKALSDDLSGRLRNAIEEYKAL